MSWDGDEYQRRFDALATSGTDVHGEAGFVRAYEPRSVLDAGCGTGRVAVELARHGIDVVGADIDASMLATARRRAPELTWVASDLAALDLGRTFDVVVMAGNVPLFTPPGTRAALVAGVARHVAPTGMLVAGFSTDRGYSVEDYDGHAAAAGLELAERFATWDRQPFAEGGDYAVSVHRRRVGSAAGANSVTP
jgi:SAM-dependent methyltransferase